MCARRVRSFVHCDPHPGNIFVRKMPKAMAPRDDDGIWSTFTGILLAPFRLLRAVVLGRRERDWQVVLLDHGLYRELTVETRLNYCQLWRALVLQYVLLQLSYVLFGRAAFVVSVDAKDGIS